MASIFQRAVLAATKREKSLGTPRDGRRLGSPARVHRDVILGKFLNAAGEGIVVSKLVQAYILVTAAIGKIRQASKELERLRGVKSVHAVTGPYDIIVVVEAKDLGTLTSTVVEGIHKIKGIVDTNTAIVIEL